LFGGHRITRPDYSTLVGKKQEKAGGDTIVSRWTQNKVENIWVQEKYRTIKYWPCRYQDIYVELKNEARKEGKGWFFLYRQIDYLNYIWTNGNQIRMLMYTNGFFDAVDILIQKEKVFYPSPHYQTINERRFKVSGCVVKQSLLDILVEASLEVTSVE